MVSILKKIEEKLTELLTIFFQSIIFFLNKEHQSIVVSIIHYIIFIIGFYYFFFNSDPCSKFRLMFFIFLFLGTTSYFLFNRCIFTSIELNLCNKKNLIQTFMDKYFGSQIEGNIISKLILSIGTLITGLILLNDYGIIKFSSSRECVIQ
jgi:hypothetical protein